MTPRPFFSGCVLFDQTLRWQRSSASKVAHEDLVIVLPQVTLVVSTGRTVSHSWPALESGQKSTEHTHLGGAWPFWWSSRAERAITKASWTGLAAVVSSMDNRRPCGRGRATMLERGPLTFLGESRLHSKAVLFPSAPPAPHRSSGWLSEWPREPEVHKLPRPTHPSCSGPRAL